MAKATQENPTAVTASKPAKAAKPDSAALLARIAEIRTETLAHPQVVNKTEEGVNSRIARILNKEKAHKCSLHRFWTGAHVAMVERNNS